MVFCVMVGQVLTQIPRYPVVVFCLLCFYPWRILINARHILSHMRQNVTRGNMVLFDLQKKLGGRVLENEMLSRHCTFCVGGGAKYFFHAKTSDEIVAAVKVAQDLNIPYYILGGGSNVLISDNGFDGLVIKAGNMDFEIRDTEVVAGAGTLTALVANQTISAGLSGLEWASSLPGTIGGAIYGNAGGFGGEMGGVVKKIVIFGIKNLFSNSRELENSSWDIFELENKDCEFGYRNSIFKRLDPKPIILSVVLELKKSDHETALTKTKINDGIRKEKQPLGQKTAGCFFKNVEFKDESEISKMTKAADVPKEFLDAKRIPAGWIIDQLGLKNYKIGGARVSDKHAGFIINAGDATAHDVVQLAAFIKTRARNEFGVNLQEEVQYVGF